MSENLTPSERNVSKAAAEKATEREVAQQTSQTEPHTAPVPQVEDAAGAFGQGDQYFGIEGPRGRACEPFGLRKAHRHQGREEGR